MRSDRSPLSLLLLVALLPTASAIDTDVFHKASDVFEGDAPIAVRPIPSGAADGAPTPLVAAERPAGGAEAPSVPASAPTTPSGPAAAAPQAQPGIAPTLAPSSPGRMDPPALGGLIASPATYVAPEGTAPESEGDEAEDAAPSRSSSDRTGVAPEMAQDAAPEPSGPRARDGPEAGGADVPGRTRLPRDPVVETPPPAPPREAGSTPPAPFWTPSRDLVGPATIAVTGLVALLLLVTKTLWIGLYSRLAGASVLRHPARARLLEQIRASPGVHVAHLVRSTHSSTAVVRHHLGVLSTHGFVVTRKVGQRRVFFASGAAGLPEAGLLVALKDRTRRRVAALIIGSTRPWTQRHVAEASGISQRLASHHLGRLEALGLVDATHAMPREYTPTPRLAAALASSA